MTLQSNAKELKNGKPAAAPETAMIAAAPPATAVIADLKLCLPQFPFQQVAPDFPIGTYSHATKPILCISPCKNSCTKIIHIANLENNDSICMAIYLQNV